MEKTTIEKTTIAKITTTALLFFLALFSLTTCLTAQESGQQARKQGWFVGVSPYFLGAEIKTTTEHTTLTERYTTGTRTLDATDVTFTASTVNQAEGVSSDGGSLVYSDDYDATARNAVRDICEDGTYGGVENYGVRNFDATTNTGSDAIIDEDISACHNYFQGLAASFSPSLTGVIVDSATLSFSTTSENTPLTGNYCCLRLAIRLQL